MNINVGDVYLGNISGSKFTVTAVDYHREEVTLLSQTTGVSQSVLFANLSYFFTAERQAANNHNKPYATSGTVYISVTANPPDSDWALPLDCYWQFRGQTALGWTKWECTLIPNVSPAALSGGQVAMGTGIPTKGTGQPLSFDEYVKEIKGSNAVSAAANHHAHDWREVHLFSSTVTECKHCGILKTEHDQSRKV